MKKQFLLLTLLASAALYAGHYDAMTDVYTPSTGYDNPSYQTFTADTPIVPPVVEDVSEGVVEGVVEPVEGVVETTAEAAGDVARGAVGVAADVASIPGKILGF